MTDNLITYGAPFIKRMYVNGSNSKVKMFHNLLGICNLLLTKTQERKINTKQMNKSAHFLYKNTLQYNII